MGAAPPLTYPLIMLLAVGTALVLSRGQGRTLGLEPRQRRAVRLGAFCGAMIGAKLPFALSDWRGLLTGRVWVENGKTLVFGLVGGYVGVEVAKALAGVRAKTGDSFAVPVAAAVGVGRLGCFVAGCCHGSPTTLPWGVDFGDGVSRHPTQLYEMAFHLAMAGLLALFARLDWFAGQRFKVYLLSYLLYRIASETIRPEPRLALGLTGYQWACLALLPVVAVLWWADARQAGSGSRAPDPRCGEVGV